MARLSTLRNLVCAALLALPTVSFAGPPDAPPPGAFRRVAEEIGLDAAQLRQVQDILYQYESAMVDLEARAQKAEMDLRHYIMADPVDEKTVYKALEALNSAEAEKKKNRTQLTLALRKVMSYPQWESLMRLREDRRRGEMPAPPERPEAPPLPPSR
jgi:hypothetical protein